MKPTDIDQQQKIAIVLATGINGLSAVRSLNTVNFQVIAITSTDKDLSASSNLPHKLYIVKDDKNWKKNMLSLLDKLNFKNLPPIVACSDKSADFLASNSNRLSLKYSLLTPSKNVTKILNDKSLEINRISSINIPMPRSLPNISKGVALGKLIELKLPVIIKPRSFKYCELINAKNIIINNETEWDKFYLKYHLNLNKLIAQEIIPGDDGNLWVCNVTFNKQSKLIAAFSFQRLGTMPSHYGVTSMAISKLNYRVIELSEKIGSALDYVGPAMFEFKYDKTSNEYLYIETNPRLGMCNWFDTCCGINNVEATCLAAMNKEQNNRINQKTDILYINILGDIVSRLENHDSMISIVSLYTKHMLTKKVWAIFLFKDSSPFFNHVIRDLIKLSIRAFKKISYK